VGSEFRRAWYLLVLDRWFTALTKAPSVVFVRYRENTAWASMRAARRSPWPYSALERCSDSFRSEPPGAVCGRRAVCVHAAAVLAHLSLPAVIEVLERLKPDVVIFDNAGRTAQLRAAKRLGQRRLYQLAAAAAPQGLPLELDADAG